MRQLNAQKRLKMETSNKAQKNMVIPKLLQTIQSMMIHPVNALFLLLIKVCRSGWRKPYHFSDSGF